MVKISESISMITNGTSRTCPQFFDTSSRSYLQTTEITSGIALISLPSGSVMTFDIKNEVFLKSKKAGTSSPMISPNISKKSSKQNVTDQVINDVSVSGCSSSNSRSSKKFAMPRFMSVQNQLQQIIALNGQYNRNKNKDDLLQDIGVVTMYKKKRSNQLILACLDSGLLEQDVVNKSLGLIDVANNTVHFGFVSGAVGLNKKGVFSSNYPLVT